MKKPPTDPDITLTRPHFLLYTGFLTLAAVSLYLAFVEAELAYLGYIWKYSTHYVYQIGVYTAALFIAAVFLIQSCLLLARHRPYATIPGLFGCLILVVFPAYLLAINPEHTVPVFVLIAPALLLLLLSILIWKKPPLKTPPPPEHPKKHNTGEQ